MAVNRWAEISECGTWRYALSRTWDESLPIGAFVGLNPSTADGETDDNTIRKEIALAQRWGWGGFWKYNLFPFRSTDPDGLWRADDPLGERGDETLAEAVLRHSAAPIVAAWGTWKHPRFVARVAKVLTGPLGDARLMCLARAKDGQPRHPLYMPNDSPIVVWRNP